MSGTTILQSSIIGGRAFTILTISGSLGFTFKVLGIGFADEVGMLTFDRCTEGGCLAEMGPKVIVIVVLVITITFRSNRTCNRLHSDFLESTVEPLVSEPQRSENPPQPK